QAEHIQELLRKNCLYVLGTITDYWNLRRRREVAWERIVMTLGKVADESILEFLLLQLDEHATNIQNALSTALSLQPESTAPLLEAILAPTATQNVIRVASNALRQIGEDCIPAICDEFLDIRSHADATEVGLRCLIDLLGELRKDGIISAVTE